MKSIVYTIAAIALNVVVCSAQTVQLKVADNMYDIPSVQTQGELKPGWKIVDIQLKDKVTHYLLGGHATQMTDDYTPAFVVTPGADETLADYALIRLRAKRHYRQVPKEKLRDNEYTRIEPSAFHIAAYGKDGFRCQPRVPLRKGEYILVNIAQRPIGELGDFMVFPFRVP